MGRGYGGYDGRARNGASDGGGSYSRLRRWITECQRGQRVMLLAGVLGLTVASAVASWSAAAVGASARELEALYADSAQRTESSIQRLLLAQRTGRLSRGDSDVRHVAGVPATLAYRSYQQNGYQRLTSTYQALVRRATWGQSASAASALLGAATGWLLLWLWLGTKRHAQRPVGWLMEPGAGPPIRSRETAHLCSPVPLAASPAGAGGAVRTACAGRPRRPFAVNIELEGESRLRLRVPVAALSGAEARRLRERLRPLMQGLEARAAGEPVPESRARGERRLRPLPAVDARGEVRGRGRAIGRPTGQSDAKEIRGSYGT